MAEGDTIKRAELLLSPLLKSQIVTEFWAKRMRGHKPRTGKKIVSVDAVGKHLLMRFDNNLVLDTHLGMDGYWRVFPSDKGAPSSRQRANPYLTLLIATQRGHALCFKARTVRTYLEGSDFTPAAKLGPDLIDPEFDIDKVISRVNRLDPATLLVDLLLDQTAACGIGNIYKSESLHIQRLYPFAAVKDVSEDTLRNLYVKASELLRRNARNAQQRRKIAPRGQFYVYKRFHSPCMRCDTPIARSYIGKLNRSTYWCPTCQPKL